MTTQSPTSKLPIIFWQSVPFIIVCGCLLSMISFGPRSALGLFLTPMTETRDWTRETFALSLAIQNLLWGAGQPVAGMLADKFGTARILASGAVFYGIGLFLMAWAPSPIWLNISAGVMVGIGIAFASFALVLATFGRVVSPAKRSMAFGVGTASGSFGQFVFAPLGQGLIDYIGWQQSLIIMGSLVLVIVFLAIPLRGKSNTGTPISNQSQQSMKQAIIEAFGYQSFVLLFFGFFVCGFHVAFIGVHLPAYIADLGEDPSWGAWALALIGMFNIIGSLISGYISGRLFKSYNSFVALFDAFNSNIIIYSVTNFTSIYFNICKCYWTFMAFNCATDFWIGCRHVWTKIHGYIIWVCFFLASNWFISGNMVRWEIVRSVWKLRCYLVVSNRAWNFCCYCALAD